MFLLIESLGLEVMFLSFFLGVSLLGKGGYDYTTNSIQSSSLGFLRPRYKIRGAPMGSVQGRNSLELFYLKCIVFDYSNRQISSPPAETSGKRIFPVRMVEKIVMFCTY